MPPTFPRRMLELLRGERHTIRRRRGCKQSGVWRRPGTDVGRYSSIYDDAATPDRRLGQFDGGADCRTPASPASASIMDSKSKKEARRHIRGTIPLRCSADAGGLVVGRGCRAEFMAKERRARRIASARVLEQLDVNATTRWGTCARTRPTLALELVGQFRTRRRSILGAAFRRGLAAALVRPLLATYSLRAPLTIEPEELEDGLVAVLGRGA